MAIVHHVRVALRGLRRRPAFTVAAIATLALGIGANTLVFTWAKALVLEPLPGVADARRVVFVTGARGERVGLSHSPAILELYRQADTTSIADFAGFEFVVTGVGGGERPRLAGAGVVTGNYFPLLGVGAQLGRGLTPADDLPGAPPAVVVADAYWRRELGADPNVVGRTIRIQRTDVPIVGVADPAFAGTYGGLAQELWVTLEGWRAVAGSPLGYLQVAARLAPGATRDDAAVEMRALAARLATADPAYAGWDARVLRPQESPRGFAGGLAPMVGVLLFVVGLVLLVACGNLAGLLLARAVDRRRDSAIRLALGANRRALLGQQFAEAGLLALGGALAGLLPAWLLRDALFAALPLEGMRFSLDLAFDGRVLAATLGVALVAGLACAAAPALAARDVAAGQALRGEGAGSAGGRGRARLRGLLVGAQLALSLATLAAAALLVRATLRDLATDPGFRRDGALVATVDLGAIGYDEARSQRFAGEALARFSALPGVEQVSLSTFVPMGVSGGGNGRRIEVEGYVPAPDESLAVVADSVGPGYFDTLAIALVAGREFAPTDRAGAPPVAVVTEAFATRYLPGGALGRRLLVAGEWREIVGVAADATYRSLDEPKLPRLYLPQLQVPETRLTFVLRAAGDPARLAEPLRAALAELDADLPLGAVQPLAAHASAGLFDRKLVSALLAGMGVIALLLAAIGLYGLLAYAVAARRRELAVRSALGAAAGDLLRLVLADAGRLLAAGSAAGLLLAWGLSRLVASVFPTVRGFDVVATLGALAVLAATAFVAAWLPARQAGRTQPALVLRDE